VVVKLQAEISSLFIIHEWLSEPRPKCYPLGTIQTKTLPAVLTPALAMDRLNSTICDLRSDPPPLTSAIIRLQVLVQQQIEAIDWLRTQEKLLPHCFFSGRSKKSGFNLRLDSTNGNSYNPVEHDLISVAGVGSAVFFRHFRPFSFDDWRSIKRFLSKKYPLIHAYGAIRFDAEAETSFYFIVPQYICNPFTRFQNDRLSYNELEGSSMLRTTIAWDNALLWTWESAIEALQATICQLRRKVPETFILRINNVPNKAYWDLAVVLAHSRRVLTTTDIDLMTWLGCLQIEGDYAYQFCLQPPYSPAFIGNKHEQLFHRKQLSIFSEALARTCSMGGTNAAVGGKFDVLSSLHPSPAVCGFPTEEARLLIAETVEMFDRGMYAGPVGWFGGGKTEFSVGIRSALVEKGLGALIYAGTGIVKGSNSSLEWEELELKTSQITEFLNFELSINEARGTIIC
ncbi:Chorismate-utilizing enzyme, C-terminal, partial [Dillenia turbinata]